MKDLINGILDISKIESPQTGNGQEAVNALQAIPSACQIAGNKDGLIDNLIF
jgi:hypothetical protein